MKCLSIKQPWAYLIMEGIKDIENRGWQTKLRERVLIHASLKIDLAAAYKYKTILPPLDQLKTGVILGSVEITDCVGQHDSKWKEDGSWGYVLKEPRKLITPWPYRGQLRFFDVNAEALVKEMKETVFTPPCAGTYKIGDSIVVVGGVE